MTYAEVVEFCGGNERQAHYFTRIPWRDIDEAACVEYVARLMVACKERGLLRHSNPTTAPKHYTRAQKDSIEAAMKQIEQKALDIMAKAETVQ
jgi:hypothetical protein